jgi:hypothetical protein
MMMWMSEETARDSIQHHASDERGSTYQNRPFLNINADIRSKANAARREHPRIDCSWIKMQTSGVNVAKRKHTEIDCS